MATDVRTFASASSEKITLAQGSVPIISGAMSFGALVYLTGGSANRVVLSLSNASQTLGWMLYSNSGVWKIYNDVGVVDFSATGTNSWYLVIVSKATGTATPRIHIFDCTAGTWAHSNGNTTIGARAAPATPLVYLGARDGADFFSGSMAAAGTWAYELSDANCVAITSFATWAASTPASLWFLNQASVGTSVPDYTGNGADQSAITGTTVSSVTIPNFVTTMPGAAVIPARSLLGVGT